MTTNTLLGIGLHAIGGIAAATCFVPQKGTSKWSYQTFWLTMCVFSWFLVPIISAFITVPDLMEIISKAPPEAMIKVTLLGAAYGFGGMAFGLSIRYIGFSLTYAIAIGISAVLGTIIPALRTGTLMQDIQKDGGGMVYLGLAIALVGVIFCGLAGIFKEKSMASKEEESNFDIKKGGIIVVIAGVLSAVFGISLGEGVTIDAIAAEHGAGIFQGNVTYIFAMGGAFLTNLIWFGIVHTKENTWSEFFKLPQNQNGLAKHYLWGSLAGILWYVAFLFYGVGHVRMGDFGFISWGIHMAMLVFFSFGVGLILKEWKNVSKKTTNTLIIGLVVLLASFSLITYGSYVGQQSGEVKQSSGH